MTLQRLSRNAPCRCGSGKKFKHCCLRRGHSHWEIVLRGAGKAAWGNRRDGSPLKPAAPQRPAPPRPDPAGLRLLRLVLDYGGGDGVTIELLRPPGWQAAVVGGVVWLDMPEMGAVGWARVLAVDPCPELEEGTGALITGWFRHRRGRIYELRVEGSDVPVGLTGAHPVWSVDRAAWVPAIELEIGERLSGRNGPARLLSRVMRAEPEPVYNLEIEGDHCFRVGEQGLLVHNASAGPTPCDSLGERRRQYDYREVHIPERHGSSRWVFMNVVERAVSWIRPADFAGGSKTGPQEQDWVQNVVGVDESLTPPPGHIDAAGHIVARELGGSGDLGARPLNLFPQNYNLNWDRSGWWRQRENEVIGLFDKGCPNVCVRILLRYDSQGMYPARPTFLIYDLWVDGVQRPTAQGDNPI
jgi:hypothetical protein